MLLRWLNADPTVASHADSVEEKQISDIGNSFCPGNYRAEVVSRRNVEPMGADSAGVSDVKTLRDATTRDTAGENWIRVAFLNDIVHVVFTA